MNDCLCPTNWIKATDNWFKTGVYDICFEIYICENCKRYYIKRFGHFVEVRFNHDDQNWYQVLNGKKVVIK